MHTRMAPLALLTITGCASLGPTPPSMREMTASKSVAATPVIATPIAAGRATTGPYREVSEQEAMAEVAPALGELAAADPALHAEVLEQLAGTKPSLWSLTVQRAKHTLAYKQQLAAKEAPAAPAETVVAKATPAPIPKPAPPVQAAPVANPVVQVSASMEAAGAPPAPEQAMPQVVGGRQPSAVIQNQHVSASLPTGQMMDNPMAAPQARALFPNSTSKAPADWRAHLDAAIAQFGETSGSPPQSTEEARERLRLQLMHLAAGDTDQAVSTPSGLSTAEQGYWSNQLYALSTMLEDNDSTDRRALVDAAARHQAEATAKLRAMGSLEIRNFVTCREVYGFGAYDPLPDARYAPGDQVILYTEIDNYRSDATSEGYRTTLASTYRLLNEAGTEVMSGDFPEVDDLCLTLRRDFHIQYAVSLPTTLATGEYRLEVAVTDRLADKIGHDELSIMVAPR